MHHIRHAIFSFSAGIFDYVCNNHLFVDLQEKEGEPALNPLALIVLVVANRNVGKTSMNPGHGAWVKGRD